MQGYDLISNAGPARSSRDVPRSPANLTMGSASLEAFRSDPFRSDPEWCTVVSSVRTSGVGALVGLDPALDRRLDAPLVRAAAGKARSATPVGGSVKRGVDVTFAVCALVVLAPMLLFLAVLIRAVTGSSPIFAHERVGFGGRSFRCFKFRTMKLEADEILKQHLAANPQAAEEWEQTRKLMHDPRINCLGNVLRKSSIDELPQLINVLKGDMSLVGPRPVTPAEMERYGRRAQQYIAVRPGVTGLWQISGRSRVNYSTRVAMDCHYVRSWSIWRDAAILIKTIPAVTKFDETA
jgi:exopolysaccharide production protein ExoY